MRTHLKATVKILLAFAMAMTSLWASGEGQRSESPSLSSTPAPSPKARVELVTPEMAAVAQCEVQSICSPSLTLSCCGDSCSSLGQGVTCDGQSLSCGEVIAAQNERDDCLADCQRRKDACVFRCPRPVTIDCARACIGQDIACRLACPIVVTRFGCN